MMKKDNFEVVLADDECSRRIHYQLRYQVFCLDTGYEDPLLFPNGEEKDEWDEHAVHFLVRERGTQQWVAAMRLVFPQQMSLPIARRASIAAGARLAAAQALEISRLCIVGHDRRRRLQAVPHHGGNVINFHTPAQAAARLEIGKRLRIVEILRGLLDAAVAYSRDSGTRHWYLLTTKTLAKVAGHVLPLDFQQVGEPVWYRGERYPFMVDIGHLVDKFAAAGAAERARAFLRHSELAVAAMPRAVGAV